MCANALILSINDSKDSNLVIFLCRASETKDDKDKDKDKPTTKSRGFGEDYYLKERSYGDEEDDDDDDDDDNDDDDGEKKQRGFLNIFRKR